MYMSPKTSKKIGLIESTSIIAHQLKNPLSVIKAYLEVLISGVLGDLSPKQKQYLEDSVKNVIKILKIVEDLLEISKVENKTYTLDAQPFDIGAVAQNALNEFTTWAKARRCNLILRKPDKLPLVLSDPRKITKVTEDLIANGIMYREAGREGTVKITLGVRGQKMLLACRDDGAGIEKSDYRKLFTKFFRSEGAIKIDPIGTGISLYLDKAIIEKSGGKLWFKNNRGRGVTFYFTLPLAKKTRGRLKIPFRSESV